MSFRRTYPAELRPFVAGQRQDPIRTLKSTKAEALGFMLHRLVLLFQNGDQPRWVRAPEWHQRFPAIP
jgi:hypothetical protein